MRSALRAGYQPALAALRADSVFPDESARARDARRRAVTGRRVDPDRARHAALAVVEPSVRQEERRDLVSRDHACDGPATGRDDGAPSSRRDAGTSPRAPWRSRCSRCGRRSRRASRARPRADSSRARSASSGTSGEAESRELRGERKADVPLTADADARVALADPAGEVGRDHSCFMHHALPRWARRSTGTPATRLGRAGVPRRWSGRSRRGSECRARPTNA